MRVTFLCPSSPLGSVIMILKTLRVISGRQLDLAGTLKVKTKKWLVLLKIIEENKIRENMMQVLS